MTAVEIMPADAFVDERHLPPLGLANAWGYNPVVFGAPDPRLAPGGWAEVRAATDALHAAGMEAILDVVFNHNGESDAVRPDPVVPRPRQRDLLPPRSEQSGAATSTTPAPAIAWRSTVRSSSRWRSARSGAGWSMAAIDGFRFDLATALGRGPNGFDAACAVLSGARRRSDRLAGRALIAEPWDIGPGGYQLGAFGPAWGEWNDRFRDAARRFWRGDPGVRGEIATRLAGSRDVFARAAAPSKSVNFIVAHDGFTLADLVSYARKHNEANGEQQPRRDRRQLFLEQRRRGRRATIPRSSRRGRAISAIS